MELTLKVREQIRRELILLVPEPTQPEQILPVLTRLARLKLILSE